MYYGLSTSDTGVAVKVAKENIISFCECYMKYLTIIESVDNYKHVKHDYELYFVLSIVPSVEEQFKYCYSCIVITTYIYIT